MVRAGSKHLNYPKLVKLLCYLDPDNCKFRDWNRIYTNFATWLATMQDYFFAGSDEPSSERSFMD